MTHVTYPDLLTHLTHDSWPTDPQLWQEHTCCMVTHSIYRNSVKPWRRVHGAMDAIASTGIWSWLIFLRQQNETSFASRRLVEG